MKYLVMILPLFVTGVLFGQGKFLLQAYRTREDVWDCHWGSVQTRYSDYVLKVFNDTSIEFEIYTQCFGILDAKYHKVTYKAKARIVNDTVAASWSFGIINIAEQFKPMVQRNLNIDTSFGFLPPAIFALKNDAAVGVGQPLPILKKAAIEDVAKLEFDFREWGENKHGYLKKTPVALEAAWKSLIY